MECLKVFSISFFFEYVGNIYWFKNSNYLFHEFLSILCFVMWHLKFFVINYKQLNKLIKWKNIKKIHGYYLSIFVVYLLINTIKKTLNIFYSKQSK